MTVGTKSWLRNLQEAKIVIYNEEDKNVKSFLSTSLKHQLNDSHSLKLNVNNFYNEACSTLGAISEMWNRLDHYTKAWMFYIDTVLMSANKDFLRISCIW